jgi:aminobenzoyl-glutamate utilization protein B
MDKTLSIWENETSDISKMIETIWGSPELPMMEYQSSESLCKWLEGEGFEVVRGYCDLPTAFIGKYGDGDYTIGILAEFDALAGLDNDACTYRKDLGKDAGHACMHCHIAGANVGAAISLKKYIESTGKKIRIAVIGTPAEEIIYGKIAIQERGGFDGIDILLTSHVDYQNGALSRMCSPCVYGELLFKGFADHGGAAASKNALDAAELTMQAVERMNARYFKNTIINYVMREAGIMPAIVPDKVLLWLTIRNMNYANGKKYYKKIIEIAKFFAKITETTVKEGYISSANGYLANDVLAHALFNTMKRVGPPEYNNSEINEIKEFCKKATNNDNFQFDQNIALYDKGFDIYGQDDGEISWKIPLGRINWAVPEQIPLHNWMMTAFAGLKVSHIGALWVSKILYLTAVDIINNPRIIHEAKKELAERTEGLLLDDAHVGSFDIFTKKPELFWSGRWIEEI